MMEVSTMMGFLVLAIGVGLLAYIGSGLAARAILLTDKVNLRSNHRRPASRAGGLVMTLIVTIGTLISMFFGVGIPGFALLVLATAALGLLDDISNIPARMKMAAMILLCGAMSAVAGPLTSMPLPMGGEFTISIVAGYILSTVFLFGFINAVNFMDGLNGMAGGASLIGLSLLLILTPSGEVGLILLYLLSASALYGFLCRNILKGGIFLGDAGSLGLAMMLGGGSLHASQSDPNAVYILAIAFLPFLLDVVLTFLRRAARGASWMEAHKEHQYQRLRALGWSHQAVSAGYAVLVLIGGASALLLAQEMGSQGLWLAGGASIGLTLVFWRVMYRKASMPDGQPNSVPDPQASV